MKEKHILRRPHIKLDKNGEEQENNNEIIYIFKYDCILSFGLYLVLMPVYYLYDLNNVLTYQPNDAGSHVSRGACVLVLAVRCSIPRCAPIGTCTLCLRTGPYCSNISLQRHHRLDLEQ